MTDRPSSLYKPAGGRVPAVRHRRQRRDPDGAPVIGGVFINPGTEASPAATLQNAEAIAALIGEQLSVAIERRPDADDPASGFYGFVLRAGKFSIEVDVPGDDPETFFLSRPFASRRMYVDGSSYLWKYAAGIICERVGLEDD